MGAAGSSNVAPPPSAPLRARSEETFIYGTEESCCPEYTNENIRQRTRASAFDVGEEPRSQGPSPYATSRDEECLGQRPSVPSLSNLPPSRRQTLLTYAAQMTDWQTAEGHSPSFSHQHQETMELSRAITQLAVANQQLASAHTATLAHLEGLYIELRKERQLRKRDTSSEEARKRRLTIEQDLDDEDPRDKKLRSKMERLDQLVKTRGPENEGAACLLRDRVLNDVPERESKSRLETTNDETWRTSVRRARGTIDEHTASESRPSDETVNLHLEKSDGMKSRIEDEPDRTKSTANKEIIMLSEEIERLKAERSEIRRANERLTSELAEQKATVQNFTKNYEASKARHEQVESSLQERKQEYDDLSRKLDVATQETDRLLKEIDAFNAQKDTAEARIVSLEQDLQKSLLEKEQIKSIENQKTLKLKAQLSEEVSDKKKQIKALEEALDEIQRLKETIKTERKNDDDDEDGSKEDVDDPEGSLPSDRTTNIEEFKKELTLKREARQRAITAVSSEMERLRRELDAEKEAHSETSRVLDLLRSVQNDPRAQPETGEADGNFTRTRTKDSKPDEHELETKRVEAQRLTSVLKVSDELRNDIRFQMEKLDDLRYHLETEPDQHRYRIRCLAEVTNKTRESVYARERRANELKDHLAQILVRLGDRSFLDLKDDVALECERQLENINSLKSLYNERLKVLTELKDAAIRELVDVKERLDHTLEKSECLEEDLKKADEKIDVQDTEILNLESQLGLTKADCRDLQNQMSLINGLFTQMLLGASSADMDLDRLTQLLQENHDLISDIAREESTEAAALPKLLLDLVEQVEGSKGTQKRADGENSGETDVEAEKKEDDLQQEDIAHNLPKVWRVLLELLSCHAEGSPSAAAASAADPNSCYKSVDTPAGPRLVISVSKTYIRLKELILEKKHLEKEMNRMKQLNTHLESKLGEQEKRLSAVSAELSKTWTIVDRMQAQHQQLHTHEKILRYELQEKRKMLQALKQELEYCREKWESARQKNTNTELEWRCLRREFAARKALAVHDSFNNSAESGFSDERGDDTDEEDDAVEGRLRLGPRRKPRKESPRAPSPDTESEQPTDTELSEPKTGSSATLEQRTSTPETETELDETEASNVTLNVVSVIATEAPQSVSEGSQESLDPLDQALTNVIQNLIAINEPGSTTFASPIVQVDVAENVANDDSSFLESFPTIDSNLECNEAPCDGDPLITNDDSIVPEISVQDFDLSSGINENYQETTDPDGEKTNIEKSSNLTESHAPTVTSIVSTLPVFSIGPFPMPVVTPTIVKNVQFTDTTIDGPSNRCFAPVFGAPLSEERFESTANHETESRDLEKRGARSTEGVVDSDSVSIDSSSSLETVKEFSASSLGETGKKESSEVGSSKQEENKVKTRTPEEALAAREDRLRRLEEQAKCLMNKMNATSRRGSVLTTRLEELHEAYGEPPVPPPMPDVLPSRRLQTNLTDLPRQVPESPVAEGTENSNTLVSSGGCNESSPDNAP